MISKKTLKMLTMVLALGMLGGASTARASNENDGGNETGGYVLPGNRDGVNPVYHPGIFGNPSAAAAYGFAPVNHKRRAEPHSSK
jgi:hypothetical protein